MVPDVSTAPTATTPGRAAGYSGTPGALACVCPAAATGSTSRETA